MQTLRETEYTRLTHLNCEMYEFVDKKNNKPIYSCFDMQQGSVKLEGVNGFQNEDLIAICIDRLQRFQDGDFPCAENEMALNSLKLALTALDMRTDDRTQRGVEGLYEK